ncbi:hypothetical protein MBUL_00600 [Methylobacterium bullatum]|uniref:Uncharacterized protein n=1 Tax=Methylobacterium bullatum TaxID=570505 RepID=A0A679INT3_9HYPH|nr:hypothetical protein MBUL_00600 [Methylobacterium bullatum]
MSNAITLRDDLGVTGTSETDNVVRWDDERLYGEHNIYYDGRLVSEEDRGNVTETAAKALRERINRAKPWGTRNAPPRSPARRTGACMRRDRGRPERGLG